MTGATDPLSPGANVICDSTIDGNLQILSSGSSSPWQIGGCGPVTVSGNLQFHSNAGTGNTIVQTTVRGNLQCQGNHDVSGSGNTVTGNRQGQCAGLCARRSRTPEQARRREESGRSLGLVERACGPSKGGCVMTRAENRISRRRFLGAVGVGAGALAVSPGRSLAWPADAGASRERGGARADHFGRIFRLPSFAEQTPQVEAALVELGKPGGLLDAADPLAAGPKQLIVDLSLSANNPNNPTQTAGTTFFGQFLDHDMTFDAGSRLARPTDPQVPATSARRPSTSTRSTAPGRSPSKSCTTPPTTSS